MKKRSAHLDQASFKGIDRKNRNYSNSHRWRILILSWYMGVLVYKNSLGTIFKLIIIALGWWKIAIHYCCRTSTPWDLPKKRLKFEKGVKRVTFSTWLCTLFQWDWGHINPLTGECGPERLRSLAPQEGRITIQSKNYYTITDTAIKNKQLPSHVMQIPSRGETNRSSPTTPILVTCLFHQHAS